MKKSRMSLITEEKLVRFIMSEDLSFLLLGCLEAAPSMQSMSRKKMPSVSTSLEIIEPMVLIKSVELGSYIFWNFLS